MKSSTTWNGNAIGNHQEKCLVKRYFKYQWYTIFNGLSNIIEILRDSSFVTTYDKIRFPHTFRHNGSAVFNTMPPMCHSCPDVNKLPGWILRSWDNIDFMSIIVCTTKRVKEMVSLCSLIRCNWVCADATSQSSFSRSDSSSSRYLENPCGQRDVKSNVRKLLSISENPFDQIFISI